MKRVLFHADAAVEMAQAAAYYEERRSGLGHAFVSEIESSCRHIVEYPDHGAPYKHTGMRRLLLRRFPYALFNLVEPEVFWVIAVAHTKRRPDYWKRRRST